MRKIEREMVAAIKAQKNWRKANTEVVCEKDNDGAFFTVLLHGNAIAEGEWFDGEGDGVAYLYSCGWKTATTKSRLNAVVAAVGSKEFIFQRKGEWRQHWVTHESTMPFREGVEVQPA
jgi:hypothetical protein